MALVPAVPVMAFVTPVALVTVMAFVAPVAAMTTVSLLALGRLEALLVHGVAVVGLVRLVIVVALVTAVVPVVARVWHGALLPSLCTVYPGGVYDNPVH